LLIIIIIIPSSPLAQLFFPSKTAEGEARAENGGGAGEGGGDDTPRAAAEADIKTTPA
jgi:hypothetical protein